MNDFIQCIQKVCPAMGLSVRAPTRVELLNDKTEFYLRSIKENMSQQVTIWAPNINNVFLRHIFQK